jgi:RNA polymerase sigma-70 factor (ECF subfamily)
VTETNGSLQTSIVHRRAESPADGDRFDAVYRDHVGYVLHSLRRLGVDERDVEDVAHDTFLVVARKLDEYDTARPLRPWLFGIAFRVALDHRRSARVRRERLDVPQQTQDAVDDRPAADLQVERTQARRLIVAALDTMRPELQAVFILHDLDEVGMPEIAQALEIPLNTSYSRLRIARAQFEAAVRELSRGEA